MCAKEGCRSKPKRTRSHGLTLSRCELIEFDTDFNRFFQKSNSNTSKMITKIFTTKLLTPLATLGLLASCTLITVQNARADTGSSCSYVQCLMNSGCDWWHGTYTHWTQSKACQGASAPQRCVMSPTQTTCYIDFYYPNRDCNYGTKYTVRNQMIGHCLYTATTPPPVKRAF